ncbi:MAG TPA: DNA-binding domain-containing protein, partial [Methylovirgula sp.]|nr:DNA-binding domain-containing protein [Methylovirgula sp.]
EGLVRALATRFPAVERAVGDEFFAAMARVYATQSPPRAPIMAFYGEEFPQFIEAFPPCAELPYLADLARIEAARTRAYHAADATPLTAEDFAGIETELATLRIRPHPSLFILASQHPIATIFAMNNGDLPLAEIEDWHGEDACVVRPHMRVEVLRLPKGGAVFLERWADGVALAEAAETALAAEPQFDLAENLGLAIRCGLVAEIFSQSQDA